MEVEALLPCSDSETDDESDSDSIDLANLRPYEFEPEISDGSSDGSAEDNNDSEEDDEEDDVATRRIGNIEWCSCGRCRSMTTYQESVCCKEDVPEDIMVDHLCITEHDDFSVVCLNNAVLKTTLSMLNNLRGDNLTYENNALRYAAYRQFTWWVHNRLGQGVRRVIPSCAIWAIRDKYPDENNDYAPFREAAEEENRLR